MTTHGPDQNVPDAVLRSRLVVDQLMPMRRAGSAICTVPMMVLLAGAAAPPATSPAIWLDAERLRPEAAIWLDVLDALPAEALDPEVYHRSAIAAALSSSTADARSRIDALLTQSFVTLAAHQRRGRVDPITFAPRPIEAQERKAILAELREAVEHSRLAELIARTRPAHPDHRALIGVLAMYRHAAARDPDNERLAAHVRRVELNLEARRWLPEVAPSIRRVQVNVAAFELEAREGERVILQSRVVVGRTDRKTPLFTSAIQEVVFNPPWHVPSRIAVEDILPRAREDPGYLSSRRITVFDVASPVVGQSTCTTHRRRRCSRPTYELSARAASASNAHGSSRRGCSEWNARRSTRRSTRAARSVRRWPSLCASISSTGRSRSARTAPSRSTVIPTGAMRGSSVR